MTNIIFELENKMWQGLFMLHQRGKNVTESGY